MSLVKSTPPGPGRPSHPPSSAKSSVVVLVGCLLLVAVAWVFFHPQSPSAPASAPAASAGPTATPPVTVVEAPTQPATPPPAEVSEAVAPLAAAPAPADSPIQTPAERLAAAVALLMSSNRDAATVRQTRDLIDSAYAPLYQQLGLNASATAAFGDLLAQRFDTDRTALAIATSEGLTLTNNPVEIAAQVRTAVTPLEGQIHTLLGDAGYQQYRTFAATIRAAVVAALIQQGTPAGK